MSEETGLTQFQIEIAQLFFALPASSGFVLAGGAALIAQNLIVRPTQDLDFFAGPGRGNVPDARDAFENAVRVRGWVIERVRDEETFCRLVVHGPDDLLVDLAIDSPPLGPAAMSIAGPTYSPIELAGRKLATLFDRAEARDFADVYVLAKRYDRAQLLVAARAVDPGFDRAVFATMLGSLDRFADTDLPVPAHDVADLRAFFAAWASGLRTEIGLDRGLDRG
jgi:hypothetical protein